MEPRVIQRRYAALLKTCEIPPIKIHALRHQFSCRWVEHGFDTKSLSEILGHTSVRTTLDLYVQYPGGNEATVYESDDGAGNITE